MANELAQLGVDRRVDRFGSFITYFGGDREFAYCQSPVGNVVAFAGRIMEQVISYEIEVGQV